jgi:hypothetical protein
MSAIVVWLCLILLRGVLIEALIAKRYFDDGLRRLLLEDLCKDRAGSREQTDHVFCCTELTRGEPVYFSSSRGGVGFSRSDSLQRRVIRDASKVQVSAVVRASAGFPGVPPRLFRARTEGWDSKMWPLRRSGSAAFLSDGGIWNNLGTQALVEDSFFRGDFEAAPSSVAPQLILCLDASADLGHIPAWDLIIPGWAEVKALWRQAFISNTNTVGPRRKNFEDLFINEVTEPKNDNEIFTFSAQRGAVVIPLSYSPASFASWLDRLLFSRWCRLKTTYGIKMDLSGRVDSDELQNWNFRKSRVDIAEFAELDPELWQRMLRQPVPQTRVRNALRRLSSRRNVWNRTLELLWSPSYKEVCQIAGQSAPDADSFWNSEDLPLLISGRTEHDILVSLAERAGWALGEQKVAKDLTTGVPTTLGRIDLKAACQLIGRGYANTAITLFMLGITDSIPSPRKHHAWLSIYERIAEIRSAGPRGGWTALLTRSFVTVVGGLAILLALFKYLRKMLEHDKEE